MKHLRIGVLAFALFWGSTLFAQNPVKIGYFDYAYVISQLPEAKAADADLKAYTEKLQKDLQAKEAELRAKYERYVKEGEKMAAPTREALAKEIETGQQQLQEFQQKAESDIMQKQNKLLAPINEKLEKTLKEVAKENGFTYVIRKEALLFEPEDTSLDVSGLVLKKLGITPAPANQQNNSIKPTNNNTNPNPNIKPNTNTKPR
ncbi:OmpH family outer membrane protein [Raineya orbicola]|jgi:outer membrane protein|uniref:Outer membrane protein n=1 Tax=Raineya orbicola TaxID=2016530 RepID=A0A2N3IJ33_9BACT|nr:OmpH family outer membrane protein [Raineya orbicola]PKQ70342.1 Outer membrane protein [Raineya orbicola]